MFDYISKFNASVAHLVEMTGHDEPYRLKKAFVETITEVLGDLKVDLFEVIAGDEGYIQRSCLEPDRPFAAERRSAVVDACHQLEIQKFCGDLTHDRYAIPIRIDSVTTDVLLVEGGELVIGELEIETITHISKLYQNYISMLHRYQHDSLTGLMNRHAFEQQMDVLHKVHAYSYYIAMIDIDHFKNINDTYGHLFGDDVLILLAKNLRDYFGAANYRHLFRFGGEEFVILMEGDEKTALELIDGFRQLIEQTAFPGVGKVTFSAGVSPINPDVPIVVSLDRADNALYKAKEEGRNRVKLCNLEALEKKESQIEEGELTLF